MANRVHCNVEKIRKRIVEEACPREGLISELERKIEESIMRSKKEHMYNMFLEYRSTYRDEKPKLTEQINKIYYSEVEKINIALKNPRNARSVSLVTQARHARNSMGIEKTRNYLSSFRTSYQDIIKFPLNWRDTMRAQRENIENATKQQISEIEIHYQKIKKKLERSLIKKMEIAKEKHKEFIEDRIQKVHFDHVNFGVLLAKIGC